MSFSDIFKDENKEFRTKQKEANDYFHNEIRHILSGSANSIVMKLEDLYQQALDNRFVDGNIRFEIHELIYEHKHNCA